MQDNLFPRKWRTSLNASIRSINIIFQAHTQITFSLLELLRMIFKIWVFHNLFSLGALQRGSIIELCQEPWIKSFCLKYLEIFIFLTKPQKTQCLSLIFDVLTGSSVYSVKELFALLKQKTSTQDKEIMSGRRDSWEKQLSTVPVISSFLSGLKGDFSFPSCLLHAVMYHHP